MPTPTSRCRRRRTRSSRQSSPFPVFTVYTPKNAASGYVDYEDPDRHRRHELRFHLDANYAGPQYSFQAETVKTDSSFIVNGRIALADIAINDGSTLLTFALWARNLFDETHIYRRSAANSSPVASFTNGVPNGSFSYAGILGDYGNFNPPRTWGAELSFKIGAPRRIEPYVAPRRRRRLPQPSHANRAWSSPLREPVRHRLRRRHRLPGSGARQVSPEKYPHVWRYGRRGKPPAVTKQAAPGEGSGAALIFWVQWVGIGERIHTSPIGRA